MNLPPFYHQWYNMTFPYDQLLDKPLVLQLINILQGKKDAGRCWYITFKIFLEKLGFLVNTRDSGLFLWVRTKTVLYLLLSTDNFLIVTKDVTLGRDIIHQINQVYSCTSKEGLVIKYLNLQIIQSPHAITIDQTQFILDFTDRWFPQKSSFSIINQPFRMDSNFEYELQHSPVLLSNNLKAAETEFGGS